MQLFAELLAFVGGLLLLRPAFRVNGLMRETARLNHVLQASTARIDREVIPLIVEKLGEAGTNWNERDDLCLRSGVSMFVASGAIKLVLSIG